MREKKKRKWQNWKKKTCGHGVAPPRTPLKRTLQGASLADSLQQLHLHIHPSAGTVKGSSWPLAKHRAGAILPVPRAPLMGNLCSKTLHRPEQTELHFSLKLFLPNPPSLPFSFHVRLVFSIGDATICSLSTPSPAPSPLYPFHASPSINHFSV